MRLLTVPIVVVGVVAVTGFSDEPSEAAMRLAFQATLADEVHSALDFAAETGGEVALAKIRAAHTDEFNFRSFTKLDCVQSRHRSGYLCEFAVRIGVVTGEIDTTMSGRFYRGARGLVFVNEEPAPAGA
jgi:hypothetical protein